MRAIALAPNSVNQIAWSGPVTRPAGCALALGNAYSVIVVLAPAPAATIIMVAAAVAATAPSRAARLLRVGPMGIPMPRAMSLTPPGSGAPRCGAAALTAMRQAGCGDEKAFAGGATRSAQRSVRDTGCGRAFSTHRRGAGLAEHGTGPDPAFAA